MPRRNKSCKYRVCCFCGLSQNNELEFGKFYEDGEIVTHYYCLLLSSNTQQRGNDNQGILGFLKTDIQKEIRRGKKLVCWYCKKTGATLGCCKVKCKKIFHFPCGLRAGTLNQFFGEFRSYCVNHRPKQKIDAEVKNELVKSSEVVCYICYEQVDPHSIVNTMWAPCCKKNAWFHRKCVQQLAMSAGYFFKCPLCNDKKSFQEAMLEFGIFIPSQDASWELVPNAFQELLYRYDQCDASVCLCPKGRKYTSFNAKWELVLCKTCGSQGIHMACGHLKWANPVWECSECISILANSKEIPSSSTARHTLQNILDSEDSDSDISVGNDIPFTSNLPITSSTSQISTIKQRPGPRTFKLNQLKINREIQNSNKQQNSINMITMLNSTNAEHSLQSTSSKDLSTNISSPLTNTMLHDYKYDRHPPIRHSISKLNKWDNDIITLDSDDDIQVINCTSLNDTVLITEDNKNEKNDLSRLKNSKSNTKHDSNSSEIERLPQKRNPSRNDTNNLLITNLNLTESDNLKKFNLQNETKSIDLDDTIKLDHETQYTCRDFISNIKITNIVSLAPEEFENVSFVGQERKINNQISQSSDVLISSNLTSQSLSAHNDVLKSNLKRKRYKALSPIISYANGPKKIKQHSSLMEETSQSSHIPLDVFTHVSSNKSSSQISNNNENASVNGFDLQNRESHIQQSCNIDEDVLHMTNEKYLLKSDASNNILNNKTDTFTILTHDGKDCTYMHDLNETNRIPENIKDDNNIKNCDGDAGTSPAVESRNRSFTNNTTLNYTEKCIKSNHSRSKKSEISEQWESQKDVEMAVSKSRTSSNKSNDMDWQGKSKTTKYNYPGLIPEYIRLRDLKFRVHNINNLQMILYDKFSVNINMECITTMKKNTTFDVSVKKAIQQNIFKTQDIPSVCNKDKSTCMFVNEHSETYQDDTKENLDPITIVPCKNTTLITNNSNISTNNNNQSENGNFTKPMSKAIEDNDGKQSYENISSFDNTENNFDVTTSYNNYNKSGNDVKQITQSPSFDNVTNSASEMHSMEKESDSYDSTKLAQHVLFFENYTSNKSENNIKNMNETDFKVSIDLKKIKNFVDNNPDLFSRYKIESNKWCIEQAGFLRKRNSIEKRFNLLEHIKNSDVDKSKHLENFTLSVPNME